MAAPIKSARKLAQQIRLARSLTQARLKRILDYDPQTGVFTWTNVAANGVKRGREAGRIIGNGERIIQVFGVNFPASSLAFLYTTGRWPTSSLAILSMTGDWPRNRVEYVNGDKSDTSWENLREATRPTPDRNPLARPRATYGVYEREEGVWEIRVWHNRKWTAGGRFPSEKVADKAARAFLLKNNIEAIADRAPADKFEPIADEVPGDVTIDVPPVLAGK